MLTCKSLGKNSIALFYHCFFFLILIVEGPGKRQFQWGKRREAEREKPDQNLKII